MSMKSVTRKDLPDLPLDPVSPKQGNMWHNTTENSIKFYDGTGVKVFVFLDQLNSHVDTSEIHVERNDNGTGDVLWSAQVQVLVQKDNGSGIAGEHVLAEIIPTNGSETTTVSVTIDEA